MAKIKSFISFDYDNDPDLKTLLCGQASNPDTPFEITDMSVKEELSGNWKEKVRSVFEESISLLFVVSGRTQLAEPLRR